MFAGTLEEQFQLIFSGSRMAAEEQEGLWYSLIDVDNERHELAGSKPMAAVQDSASLSRQCA